MWKLDTGKKGEQKILKEYQSWILTYFCEQHDTPLGSGEVYKYLIDQNVKISRASVILFLNDLVDDGILNFEDATGKGGHFRKYINKMPWDDMRIHITTKLIQGIADALGFDPWYLERATKAVCEGFEAEA